MIGRLVIIVGYGARGLKIFSEFNRRSNIIVRVGSLDYNIFEDEKTPDPNRSPNGLFQDSRNTYSQNLQLAVEWCSGGPIPSSLCLQMCKSLQIKIWFLCESLEKRHSSKLRSNSDALKLLNLFQCDVRKGHWSSLRMLWGHEKPNFWDSPIVEPRPPSQVWLCWTELKLLLLIVIWTLVWNTTASVCLI